CVWARRPRLRATRANLQVQASLRLQTGNGLERRWELSSHAVAATTGRRGSYLLPCASCRPPVDVAYDALSRGPASELHHAAGGCLIPDVFVGLAPVRTTR